MDTIYALATPPGRGGVAVMRVSGPAARDICGQLCRLPDNGQMRLSKVRSPHGALLDQALILCFQTGKSFTGDETVELHLHGSIAVVEVISQNLHRLGARLADPGEFTRRALENGQLSLVEVEALSDLIDAETATQHQQAIHAFAGTLRAEIEDWCADIIHATALLEASIDFADEDIPEDVMPDVRKLIIDLSDKMTAILHRSESSEQIRSGFRVAIVGEPNAGKSTLLNALAGDDVAITSEFAGTTRDIVSVRVNLNGQLVEFSDTAGIRDTDDPVEKIGVDRAKSYAASADVRLFLVNHSVDELPIAPQDSDIIVYGKADLRDLGDKLAVSGKTGQGVDAVLRRISDLLAAAPGSDHVLIRERQRQAVTGAVSALFNANRQMDDGANIEIVVYHLYQARSALDFVLGRLDVENVLDEVFSSFCIGK